MQDYKNYHIVVIDDHSTDGTGVLIKNYLEGQKKVPAERYKIIRNN
jgi:glycosyltransferase involved in cell wall biosynthesis